MNLLKQLKTNEKGFSLVELIVSLAIVAMVVAVIFSLFFFGDTTFAKGVTRAQHQAEMRLAADFISTCNRQVAVK